MSCLGFAHDLHDDADVVAWVSAGIAAVALMYAFFSNLVERRERRRQFQIERSDRERQFADERTLREREFDLMRQQAEAAAEDRRAQRTAYVSVEQRQGSGGEQFDRHTFRVTNAGPSMARHIALRVDNAEGETVAGPMKIDPHILEAAQTTEVELQIPRAQRLNDLHVVVEWVDAEQDHDWLHGGLKKHRLVAEPVEPVVRMP